MTRQPPAVLKASFSRRYTSDVVIHGELTMAGSQVTALLGPSGCGKTTVLRSLAGLERPETGRIAMGDALWLDTATGCFVPARRRGVGLLFQEYALFPHMTVRRNIAYGMDQTDAQASARLLERFGLEGMGERYPHQLSGGQQQRVALARALAARPRLLLLDEPLAALDSNTRRHTRQTLGQMLEDVAMPTVLVTHDHEDVMALAHHVVVMDQGHVLQTGPVDQVFSQPASLEVARIIGMEHVLHGQLLGVQQGMGELDIQGCRLRCVTQQTAPGPVTVCMHARDVWLENVGEAPSSSVRNRLPARVQQIVPCDAMVRVHLDAGFALTAIITHAAREQMRLEPGQQVVAAIKAASITIYPRSVGTRS